jgi:hypothetical protein
MQLSQLQTRQTADHFAQKLGLEAQQSSNIQTQKTKVISQEEA